MVKSIVILTDSREQKNQHITDWFDKKKIPHEVKALSNGDYSFYIPSNEQLNIDRPLYFDKQIMVERKNSLEELSSCFTISRTRFEEELATCPAKKYLLIENANYEDIINKKYDTKLSSKAYLASVHAFNHRYNLEIMFMPNREYSPIWIYGTFVYYLKNIMR